MSDFLTALIESLLTWCAVSLHVPLILLPVCFTGTYYTIMFRCDNFHLLVLYP